MPAGKYYGDPFSNATEKIHRKGKRKVKRREVAASPVSVCDGKIAAFAELDSNSSNNPVTNTESWLVPFEQASESTELDNEVTVATLMDGKAESQERFESADPADGQSGDEDVIRCNGPVVRMKYEGEMVSVSEQTAVKLQDGECDWV